jgi:AcrR family transcriptional regulator
MEATVDALLDVGYAQFTTTDVAARSGVSRGAQNHYFRGKTDLVLAAARYEMDKATAAAHKIADRARRSRDPVDAFIKDTEEFFFARWYPAMMEIGIACRTNSDIAKGYAPIVEGYRTIINGIWLEVFQDAGIPKKKAEALLHLTLYLFRGMALFGTYAAQPRRKEIIDQWRFVARQILG